MPKRKTNPVQKLADAGQSVWLDNINRSLLSTGRLGRMIDEGLRGLTSNPTIFEKAVSSSSDYDGIIRGKGKRARSLFDIYDALTTKDIQDAADAFLPVYRATKGTDGYVSLEINPKLAHDTQGTIKEGRRLYRKVGRPNMMLKVPATEEGFAAVEEFIAAGMSVNVTLIFSRWQYDKAAVSYIRGLQRLDRKKGDLGAVRSVASVFVSRIDSVVDGMLDERIAAEKNAMKRSLLEYLKGKAAVANCSRIYHSFKTIFASDEFQRLKDKGARVQRVLWASTGTKNPAYNDTKYVTELVAPDTVNTLPENTYTAVLDHGSAGPNNLADIEVALKVIGTLSDFGIDVDKICAGLLKDGVGSFVRSIDSLFTSIEKKTESFAAR